MTRYKIIRFFFRHNRKRVVQRGLTLLDAQAHCHHPEASAKTATSAAARRRTRTHGPWFDGYDEE